MIRIRSLPIVAAITSLFIADTVFAVSPKFEITITDSGNVLGDRAADLETLFLVAAADWTGQVDSELTIEIDLAVVPEVRTGEMSIAASWHTVEVTLDTVGELKLVEPGISHELRTGVDPNGPDPDGHIELSADAVETLFWLDPKPTSREVPVPVGRVDLYSTLLHELGHLLGLSSKSCPYAGGCDVMTPYDEHVHVSEDGTAVFAGEQAAQTFGEPVPLAREADRYSHTDVAPMLMDARGRQTGKRYWVSQVEFAMLADLGLPVEVPADACLPQLDPDGDGRGDCIDHCPAIPLHEGDANLDDVVDCLQCPDGLDANENGLLDCLEDDAIRPAGEVTDSPLRAGTYEGRVTHTKTQQNAGTAEPLVTSFAVSVAEDISEDGLPTLDGGEAMPGSVHVAEDGNTVTRETVSGVEVIDDELIVSSTLVTEFQVCIDNTLVLTGTAVATYRAVDECTVEYTRTSSQSGGEVTVDEQAEGTLRANGSCAVAVACEPELVVRGVSKLAAGETATLTAELRCGASVTDVTEAVTWQVLDAGTETETNAAEIDDAGLLVARDDLEAPVTVQLVAQISDDGSEVRTVHFMTLSARPAGVSSESADDLGGDAETEGPVEVDGDADEPRQSDADDAFVTAAGGGGGAGAVACGAGLLLPLVSASLLLSVAGFRRR